jgi:hypothetical protein
LHSLITAAHVRVLKDGAWLQLNALPKDEHDMIAEAVPIAEGP